MFLLRTTHPLAVGELLVDPVSVPLAAAVCDAATDALDEALAAGDIELVSVVLPERVDAVESVALWDDEEVPPREPEVERDAVAATEKVGVCESVLAPLALGEEEVLLVFEAAGVDVAVVVRDPEAEEEGDTLQELDTDGATVREGDTDGEPARLVLGVIEGDEIELVEQVVEGLELCVAVRATLPVGVSVCLLVEEKEELIVPAEEAEGDTDEAGLCDALDEAEKLKDTDVLPVGDPVCVVVKDREGLCEPDEERAGVPVAVAEATVERLADEEPDVEADGSDERVGDFVVDEELVGVGLEVNAALRLTVTERVDDSARVDVDVEVMVEAGVPVASGLVVRVGDQLPVAVGADDVDIVDSALALGLLVVEGETLRLDATVADAVCAGESVRDTEAVADGGVVVVEVGAARADGEKEEVEETETEASADDDSVALIERDTEDESEEVPVASDDDVVEMVATPLLVREGVKEAEAAGVLLGDGSTLFVKDTETEAAGDLLLGVVFEGEATALLETTAERDGDTVGAVEGVGVGVEQ